MELKKIEKKFSSLISWTVFLTTFVLLINIKIVISSEKHLYLYAIQAFLETNDIKLNWKKIRRPGLIL